MPKYAKFFKYLLKRKDKLGEISNIPLTRGCSAVVLNKLPEKLTDPGVFTIPCLFGGVVAPAYALADLGPSINLMLFSLYERLGLGELTPTRMSLSLADRSVKYPRGVVENLFVKVDRFVFPVDFVILDMEADERVPIILGRPFLRTANAIIDVFDGKITLRAGDENATFEIGRSMRHPSGRDEDNSPFEEEVEVEEVVEEEDPLWAPETLELCEVREESESRPIDTLSTLELKRQPRSRKSRAQRPVFNIEDLRNAIPDDEPYSVPGYQSLEQEAIKVGIEVEGRRDNQRPGDQEVDGPRRRQPPLMGVKVHFRPVVTENDSPIVPQPRGRVAFDCKPNYINILPHFNGRSNDEPYTHLAEFSAICSTIGGGHFSQDEVRLRLFQFSLKDKAK
ncbi:uncharacterized protein LOC110882874 [Helianthus annuus]|uniref:uncharacterized protein LOC110882874 n=1 Tax=Helianthus annuus TaxID=4232 RepID=UPI000B8FAF83|nr:uncharacterized protein LOC110882874 [Helianthus annuus]